MWAVERGAVAEPEDVEGACVRLRAWARGAGGAEVGGRRGRGHGVHVCVEAAQQRRDCAVGGELRADADVPIGVVFEDERAAYIVVDYAG